MVQVEHQPENNRFIINLDDKQAVLGYKLSGNNINFNRTYVPLALRGQHYAETLVKTGLSWAREQPLEIKADCWFARQYLD